MTGSHDLGNFRGQGEECRIPSAGETLGGRNLVCNARKELAGAERSSYSFTV